ncbi:hypothetical protein GCM10023219_20550 [Stakelama sediminis]|uniref:Ectoine hydroxylase-related dioxygenase (Phytanoyl-CoA dioxygenase family) n=1 Tax=Stakelama sediminis TaxID=463200 RepID=A0A840Z2N2_9SPHN|nr:phytanoyl-CoA dioxygenase family protein [Stakelama sediminis]MBB5719922.1 ectoine hydroxylase-related dioxygenase (phytanoyl-CoA dioxygenase family) [Stakelama sediminis]
MPIPPVTQGTSMDHLRTHGWCLLGNALAADTLATLDADLADAFATTPFCRGNFYGETTRRFGRLLMRSRHVEKLVLHPDILAIAERVLLPACDSIQLNTTQAIALHPGAPAQMPHRDQDMWQTIKGEREYLVNVMWPLTPFCRANGATMIWPDSHGRQALQDHPGGAPVAIEMKPGSALIWLGSTLHGAGGNRSDTVRRGIVIGYSLGWLKPYENPWLAYPPAVARQFPPALAALAGYRQHRPNLGNFEGNCPSVLLDDSSPDRLGAVDALRPDQQQLVDAHCNEQRGRR